MSFLLSATAFPGISPNSKKLPKLHPPAKRSSSISCNQNQQNETNIDRRNVLIGLGSLCGASPVLTNTGAIAAPIQAPDLTTCHEAYDEALKQRVKCCRPVIVKTKEFQFPDPRRQPMRIRRPANKMDPKSIAKFSKAIAKMKALPADDPRNFIQQAQIHCAFCQGAYDETGYPSIPIQVHGSWLFPAWHRFYIYFWEKILGDLIGDPAFAIPYWNWSDPQGMKIPKMYLDKFSPLYNNNRDHTHYDALLNYKYTYGSKNPTPSQAEFVVLNNLATLNYDFRESKKKPELFMGGVLTAGEKWKEQYGSLETVHNTIHMWVGPPTSPNWDMGNLHTAARDTIFFGHHANVDRLWNTYQLTRGMQPEFDTPDWLEATFVFPDPYVKGQVIKCKVRDSLDPMKLRYTYESVKPEDQEFIRIRERFLKQRKDDKLKQRSAETFNPVTAFGSQPLTINKTISVLVKRPKVSRTKGEKEETSEVLVLDDIDYEDVKHARLDVYIDKPIDGKVSSDLGELVGSYVKIPNTHKGRLKPKNSKRFGITSLLDDIEAEDSDSLVVSFVPRLGEVTIGGVSIVLDS